MKQANQEQRSQSERSRPRNPTTSQAAPQQQTLNGAMLANRSMALFGSADPRTRTRNFPLPSSTERKELTRRTLEEALELVGAGIDGDSDSDDEDLFEFGSITPSRQ